VAAENVWFPPEVMDAVAGLTDTESRGGPVVEINAGELCMVMPLSVALTKRPTVPTVLPAVKFIDAPVPLSEPIAPSVIFHEYEMPGGQIALHAGMDVKVCVPPEARAAVAGLISTEERVGGGGLIIRLVEELTD
jgi:hypothetical protein